MRHAIHRHESIPHIAPFPNRVDTHFETTRLPGANRHEHTSEQEELVYEVSSIEELGMWRRFLTSRRMLQN
jgi:hypothetical protein